MKHLSKRIMAIFLAALLVLSAGVTAAAAEPTDTVTITKMPTKTTFRPGWEWPDLSGLEVKVAGAINQTIRYDDVCDDTGCGPDKITWSIDAYPGEDGFWSAGPKKAVLYVTAWQCTQFHVERVIDGVEYGYYDHEDVFEATCEITLTAIEDESPPTILADLELNVPVDVDLPDYEDEFYMNRSVYYRFTAPADGHYSFRSQGGEIGEYLYTRDGKELEIPTMQPSGTLYDTRWNEIGDNISFYDDPNFSIFSFLRKGQVVYLCADAYSEGAAQYTVTVGTYDPNLKLNVKEITVLFHELIEVETLLEGTDLSEEDVDISYDSNAIRWDCRGMVGNKRGTTVLTVYDRNGASADITVHVKYSFKQWLCVIFLGGFAWMEYTLVGPFDLGDNIRELKNYGVGNALYDMLGDWGIPYQLIRWLLR